MKHQTTELSRAAATELRAHIARLDLPERAAAELIGVDPTWLNRRLHGRGNITLDDIELICSKLHIPVSEVIR